MDGTEATKAFSDVIKEAVTAALRASSAMESIPQVIENAVTYGAGILVRNEDGTFACAEPANVRLVFVGDGDLKHDPFRGSDVEEWITSWRDKYGDTRGPMPISQQVAYNALDDMLEDYRVRSDTGKGLVDDSEATETPAEPDHGNRHHYVFTYGDGTKEIIDPTSRGEVGGTMDKQQRAFTITAVYQDGYERVLKDRLGGGVG